MRNIYLVHDSQESPAPRKNYLEMSGFAVTMCSSARELRACLESKVPDLLMMDVLIEGKNGFALCAELRERHAAKDLPIVLCTRIYRSRIYREEALNAGAQRYLLQPLKHEDVVRHVTELLIEADEARNGRGRNVA